MTRGYIIHPTLLDWELIAQPALRFLPCGGEKDVGVEGFPCMQENMQLQ
jgi:hypothetical protein